MVKLIITDVDGTLIPDGISKITPRYYDVIRELKKRGILFGVASGRQYQSIQRLFEPIKDDIIYIAENGGFVVYEGKELFYHPLTKKDSEEIVIDTRKIPECMCLYDTKYVSYYEKGGEEVYYLMKDGYQYDCKLVDDLLNVSEPCVKYSVYRAEKIEEMTKKEFNPKWSKTHQVACGGTRFMDVTRCDVSKGIALKSVQEKLNILPEETMVFGDNNYDIDMLKQAYYSFAVGNARQEVKEIASYITSSNQEDGVLRVLETLLEIGINDEKIEKYRKNFRHKN